MECGLSEDFQMCSWGSHSIPMKEIYRANHNKWYSAVSQCIAVDSSQNMTRTEIGQGTFWSQECIQLLFMHNGYQRHLVFALCTHTHYIYIFCITARVNTKLKWLLGYLKHEYFSPHLCFYLFLILVAVSCIFSVFPYLLCLSFNCNLHHFKSCGVCYNLKCILWSVY